MNNKPIGIFDSGIGGLTVAKAVHNALPNEKLIYFGDTAHLPYGDKSAEAITQYSIGISKFLLEKGCKIILIACNSASSAAFDAVKEFVGERATVIDVINPIVRYVEQTKADASKIGLIGTKQTINSGNYARKIHALNKNIELKALATPLLAHLIEEGFYNNKISHEVISEYLSSEELKNIESIILGCTHYPLIKNEIAEFYKHKVEIIDSSEIVAKEVKDLLHAKNLFTSISEPQLNEFYVSDYTKSFEESTRLFFGKTIHLAQYPIWD